MLHILNLLGGERNYSVKFGKCYVDNLHGLAYVRAHLLHVTELLDGVTVTFLGYGCNLVHLFRHAVRDNNLGLGPVPLFGQAQTFHVINVVGVVVECYVHVKLVESFYKHTLLV